MLHEIRINIVYADAIIDGRKNFEVRFNDKGYNAGDQVKFKVYDGAYHMSKHALDGCIYDITYVHSGLGVKRDYVVFGIKATEEKEEQNELEKWLKTV